MLSGLAPCVVGSGSTRHPATQVQRRHVETAAIHEDTGAVDPALSVAGKLMNAFISCAEILRFPTERSQRLSPSIAWTRSNRLWVGPTLTEKPCAPPLSSTMLSCTAVFLGLFGIRSRRGEAVAQSARHRSGGSPTNKSRAPKCPHFTTVTLHGSPAPQALGRIRRDPRWVTVSDLVEPERLL
ncbi:MAG: hypothetical protein KatS3mg077_1340 [Candidatus Binatia bacterium]|nr:MAG: hypothetical protein KatS3mg077_1340 [Candidatus Binatia bacterium]